ncbi:AgmX/PglI C-terminal domain-containing protein [Persicimonas caeni]|uniref:AgmX/PglI C-terminal domain-containing protein n=1 Tax=Persicimonas caeni TaxID=2292766 RepID=A0A4Y6PTJ5_PERCE|nr:AgmX/PglI C-terminal domain-containing protein [Persicimonas caeni]QDG51095.1 AgmX/PglI C-terminal domain-containing protein [Persicimonas caeni]QED32316.1 AgmX/PglI C-terminal domain-containing protein [Persicimonas caeni]
MMSWRTPAATMLAALAVAAGCEKTEPPQPPEQPASEEADAPAQIFTWQDAAKSTPKRTQKALGEAQGCEPEARLPSTGPENRQRWLSMEPYCKFTEKVEPAHQHYSIEYIAYSQNEPALMLLKPRGKATRPAEALDTFELPALSMARLDLVGAADKQKQIELHRAAELPLAAGEVVGFDLVSKEGRPRELDHVRIYLQTGDRAAYEHAKLPGPPVAREQLVLPKTSSGMSPRDPAYVEIGPDTVDVGPYPVYPAPLPDAEANAEQGEVARASFATEKLDDLLTKWPDTIKDVVEANQGPLALDVLVAIDRATPVVTLEQFGRGMASARLSLELLGRSRVPSEHDTVSQGAPRFMRLTVASSLPKTHPKTGKELFTMTAALSAEGIDLITPKGRLPSLDGCPKDGPTLCLEKGDIDVADELAKARERQEAGELQASQDHVDRALSAYDWTGLYAKLTEVKGYYPKASVIGFRPTDDIVPVAVLVHAMDVARFKRKKDGSECAEAFESDAALLEAEACLDDDTQRRAALFRHAYLLAEEDDTADTGSAKTTDVIGEDISTSGSLDKRLIKRVFRAHRRELLWCYKKARANKPGLAGEMHVKYTISGSGDVIAALVRKGDLRSRDLESCVTQKMRRWVFPEPKDGGIAVVNQTLKFVHE